MGGGDEIRFLAGLGECAKRNQKDQQANAFHGRPIVMPENRRTGKPCRAWRCRAGKLPNELNINLPHDPLRPLHGGVTFGKSAQLG
jgi:hypothetical protein